MSFLSIVLQRLARIGSAFLLVFAFTLQAFAQQAGDNDLTFNATDTGLDIDNRFNGTVQKLITQSDGKILAGGSFTTYNGLSRPRIVRINADGSLDESFNPGLGANGVVNAIGIQSDGKIVIGGEFTSYNGTTRNRIARLNTNGTLDLSFDPGTGANGVVYSIIIQTNALVIAGSFTSYNGVARNRIAGVFDDGSLNDLFDPGTGANDIIHTMSQQGDGKIIIGGRFTNYNATTRNRVARIWGDGTLDATFDAGTGPTSWVFASAIQSDGAILVGGFFTSVAGTTRNKIARLLPTGAHDLTFNPGTGADNSVWTIAIQNDGMILIGGFFTAFNGTSRNRITRLNLNGSQDAGFNAGSGLNKDVFTIALETGNKILVGGDFFSFNGNARSNITRLNGDGSVTTAFAPGTGANGPVMVMVRQADGKIIIGGKFTSYNGKYRNKLARINSDGSLDETFNPGAGADYLFNSGSVDAIALQPDGKIIIGGWFNAYDGAVRTNIARVNTDGTNDNTFLPGTGANQNVAALAVMPDGKILVGGAFATFNGISRNRFARLDANGALDATFSVGTGFNDLVSIIVRQADGKILIGGRFDTYNNSPAKYLVRLNDDATVDAGFNMGAGIADATSPSVSTLSFQTDGKIVVGGKFSSVDGAPRHNLGRINPDGSNDASFIPTMGVQSPVDAAIIQADGKIVIGGAFTAYNNITNNNVARVNTDGTLDISFKGNPGAASFVRALLILPDDKILMAGYFTSHNGIGRNRITRLITESPSVQNAIPNKIFDEDFASATIDLTNTFADPQDDPLSLSVVVTNSAIVTASITGNTLTLTEAGAGTTLVTVTAIDNNGGSVSAKFNVTVNAINDAPIVANPIADRVFDERFGSAQVSVSGVFTDVEGNSLTRTASSNNPQVVTASISGTTLTLTEAGVGTAIITVSADDGNGGSVSDTFTVTVNDVNRPPVLTRPIDDIIVNERFVSKTVNVGQNFSDPDNDVFTLTAVSSNVQAVTVSVSSMVITITEVASGQSVISVTFTDGKGGSVSDQFNVTVNEVNRAPVVQTALQPKVLEGGFGTFSIDLAATFTDADGDLLSISASSGNPAIVTTSVTGTMLKLTEVNAGKTEILITANDSNGGTVSTSFALEIIQITGIEEEFANRFAYYPNPTKNTLTINGDEVSEIKGIKVIDLLGHVAHVTVSRRAEEITLDLSTVTPGVYIVSMEFQNRIAVKKITKEN